MTTLSLNSSVLFPTMGAAMIILVAYMLKNYDMPYIICSALLGLGWVWMAYLTGYKNGRWQRLPVIASSIIAINTLAVWYIHSKYGYKNMPKWAMIFYATFAAGWILFGYSISMGKRNPALWLGMGAAAAVVFSILFILPWQRSNCFVEGPGMVAYVLGWVAIATPLTPCNKS